MSIPLGIAGAITFVLGVVCGWLVGKFPREKSTDYGSFWGSWPDREQ